MNVFSRFRAGQVVLLTGLLLASCSAGDTAQNPEVISDGENCQYQGPDFVSAGNLVFVFHNLSDNPGAHLHVNAVPDAAAWPTIVEASAEGSLTAGTGGMRELYGGYEQGNSDAEEYALEPGAYGEFCVIHEVNGWPAVLLNVKP